MMYIDTSVLAAYYCPESLSRRVQVRLDQLDAPVISPLVELELHSALALKVRNRELVEADAGRILSVFQVHLADAYYPGRADRTTASTRWLGRGSAASERPCARWTPCIWRRPSQMSWHC